MNTQLIENFNKIKNTVVTLNPLNMERLQNLFTLGMEHQFNMELKESRTTTAKDLYPQLTTYEVYLYKFAFPESVQELNKYSDERVPDFVINNAANGVRLNLFESVQIWKPKNEQLKDPMMVGIIGNNVFNLGIWGEPFINLEVVEKQMLGSFYYLRHRIKKIIDKMPIASAHNNFTVRIITNDYFDIHCKTRTENLTELLCFHERDENRVWYNHRRLALCPQCQKIVDCSPTEME